MLSCILTLLISVYPDIPPAESIEWLCGTKVTTNSGWLEPTEQNVIVSTLFNNCDRDLSGSPAHPKHLEDVEKVSASVDGSVGDFNGSGRPTCIGILRLSQWTILGQGACVTYGAEGYPTVVASPLRLELRKSPTSSIRPSPARRACTACNSNSLSKRSPFYVEAEGIFGQCMTILCKYHRCDKRYGSLALDDACKEDQSMDVLASAEGD
ncbi:hypothetical protein NMY22_g9545 [Coprinellus aureogranulatus]|nr:hypothetical protein NMY22_g9545 [Coprinellus aureogranulatus]